MEEKQGGNRSSTVLVGEPYPNGIEIVEDASREAETLKRRIITGFSVLFGFLLLALSAYAMGSDDPAMVHRVFDFVVYGITGALIWAGLRAIAK